MAEETKKTEGKKDLKKYQNEWSAKNWWRYVCALIPFVCGAIIFVCCAEIWSLVLMLVFTILTFVSIFMVSNQMVAYAQGKASGVASKESPAKKADAAPAKKPEAKDQKNQNDQKQDKKKNK